MPANKVIPDKVRELITLELDNYMDGKIKLKDIAKKLDIPYSWVTETQKKYIKKALGK